MHVRWIKLWTVWVLLALCWIPVGRGLEIESHYSPLNRKRELRKSTEFIILHTTEGGATGSLEKLRRYGEAHYMVDTNGKVTRIISRDRIAYHCGRSMWNGKTNLDDHSVGIEIVGYHDKPLTRAQISALRELLRQLQAIYGVPDSRVLPHSMVAYGRPNRWHPYTHRGRKRCAMLLSQDNLRRELGLTSKPRFDPDVRVGRLKVADAYLNTLLFASQPETDRPAPTVAVPSAPDLIARGRSAWDIARENYNSPGTTYFFPDGSVKTGDAISDWNRIPPGTRVQIDQKSSEATSALERVQVVGRDGVSASEIAGAAISHETTIYFLPDGMVRKGTELTTAQLLDLPEGTGMLVGYVHGGSIRSNRRAFDICGPRWNLPTTFYRFPDGEMWSGGEVDERGIPIGTLVFFQP